ncbi:MAG: FkbM family methyltransferase [Planctomycetota bacterium]|jgi:FkbM family methyltransferase|nr:FkbM family methyltransferase [Planctomycetota bacterium]
MEALLEHHGVKVLYREHSADERVIAHSFENDVYLRHVPELVLHPAFSAVEIGAHIGAFALWVGVKAPRGSLHAVEASRESFSLLQRNIALNDLSNVHPHHLAIAGTTGTVELFHNLDSGNWGHTITARVSESSESVSSQSLAEFCADAGIERADLLKINCEGAEFEILLRASHGTLRKFDLVVALYHLDLCEGHSVGELVGHLERAGFTVRLRNRSGGGSRGWIVARNRRERHTEPLARRLQRRRQSLAYWWWRVRRFAGRLPKAMASRAG